MPSALPTTYASKIKPCIVAFIQRWVPASGQGPPPFPEIVATGFVVHPNGLVATNRHVVEAFTNIPEEVRRHLPEGRSPFMAGLLVPAAHGLQFVAADVVNAGSVDVSEEMLTKFHPEQADLAFARIDICGLPVVTLAKSDLEEGMELATAGYPFGSGALVRDGLLRMLGPTLQRGIVSAILPFPGSHPHGFMMNVMIQGGASGSPAFDPETGEVYGILHTSLVDHATGRVRDQGLDIIDTLHADVPTNYSLGIPAHVIRTCLEIAVNHGQTEPAEGARYLSELQAESPQDPDKIWTPWY